MAVQSFARYLSTTVMLLYLCLFFSLKWTTGASEPFKSSNSASTVNVSTEDFLISVTKSPWHISIYEKSLGRLVLDESGEEKSRLGFGEWIGEYLHFYEGYLFRVGVVTKWNIAKEVTNYTISNDSATFILSTSDSKGVNMAVSLKSLQPKQLDIGISLVSSTHDSINANRVRMGFVTPNNEGFFGFGERFNDVNQRGHVVGSWLEDGSWGLGMFEPSKLKFRVPKGELSTYCPMPLMISTRGYGLQMNTFYRTTFDLAKSVDGVMILEQESDTFNLTLFSGETPQEIFQKQVEKNGHSLIPPPWAFSPWNQLSTEVEGKSIVDRAKQLLFDEDIPCSFSVNTVHFFPGGSQRGNEKQLAEENAALKAIGIKNTAYFNAMLESSYTELYNVAAENGYFVKTKEGLPYNYSYIGASSFYVSQVDYTNALAVKWYQTQLQGAVDVGFHGWMYDYGEYTPPDSVSSDGTIGLEMHNKFPLLYQKTAFDFFKKFDKNTSDPYAPDYVFYVRSSYTGSQRYTWAHWTGDPSSDWSFASGLPAQITASLNIGLSGMPFSGSDIGGFEWYVDRVPDLELWVRWTQAGCFSGLMHEQGGGKGHGSKSHIFDWPEGTRIWRKYAKLRMQLFPYIYTQAHTAHQNGMPIMRQHILSFPDDVQAIRQAQQYMFGESFLAAPVVRQGAVEWDVYLPTHGSGLGPAWLDVGSTMQYDESDGRFRIGFSGYFEGGKTVRVSASLDVSPLFVLAGTITPASDPRIMSLNNATDPHVVTWQQLKNISYLWVWADASFSASGHSFMGYTYSMEKSQSVKDVVEFTINGPKGTTHITQISADWKGKPKNVYTEQNLPFVTSWKDIVASTSASCWSFDDAQKVVWVRTSGEEFSFKIEKAS